MIYGDRVRQAREIRGLTQPALAESIGVSQAAVSKIESGQIQPAADTVASLALATGFPPAFFRWPSAGDLPLGSLLYRAQTSLRASDRDRAHEWASLLWDAVAALAAQLDLVPVRLPRLTGEDPATAARITRSELGLGPDVPVPHLVNALERAGVLVLSLPETVEALDAFSVWAGGEHQVPLIVVSPKTAGDRQRLSVAHEAGHLVVHRPPMTGVKQAEAEAATFAAELLMPEEAMRREIVAPVTLTGLAALKPRWGVAIQALIRRARDLGIVSDRQYRYLFQQVGARGWRTHEPENLAVAPEKPRGFRKMLEVLYGRPIDLSRMMADIPIPPSEAKRIVAVHADLSELPGRPPPDAARGRIGNVVAFPGDRQRSEARRDR